MFKSGFKTTEFAFVILFMVLDVLAILAGQLQEAQYGVVAGAIVTAAYAIARGMAKANGVEPPASKPKL